VPEKKQPKNLRQFAESEIVLPDGPFVGQRFLCSRQPAHGLFFDAVDQSEFFRYACTGPQQSGKTLAFVVIPILYHLFERRQTVLFGLPSMDMANDKWKLDVRPAIEASRFAKYLPRKGAGSQGGTPELIQFSNGANLKFITAGGGDEKRSGFTGPVLVVTEVSHLDETGGQSDEATKLKQMEGRVRAYRASGQARVYLESTVTTEHGRMWQEWQQGTAGEVVFPCHSCGRYISPGRDNLIGWQDSETESAAERLARWSCPECGIVFDDQKRLQQLRSAVLLHRGQSVAKTGRITGKIPETKTLGFRYSAATNTFVTSAIIGGDEWRAEREVDQELAERELLQWTWALPARPAETQLEPLDHRTIMLRQHDHRRGEVPDDTIRIAAGVDVRSAQLDWFVTAEQKNGRLLCIDYGFEPILRELSDLQTALRQAIRTLQEKFAAGWEPESGTGNRSADITLVDSGWETDLIREESQRDNTWQTAMGFGFRQHRGLKYTAPKRQSRQSLRIGEGWHDVLFMQGRRPLREYQNNADHWKRRVHQALSVDQDAAGALLLPRTDKPQGRAELARQLTAEREVQQFEIGKGTSVRWVQTFSRNHLLDACYMSFVGLSVLQSDAALAERRRVAATADQPEKRKRREKFVRSLKQ